MLRFATSRICSPIVSRSFSTTITARQETVKIHFVDTEGHTVTANAKIGENLLEVAQNHKVDLEGACDGTLACSTCHLVLPESLFNALDEPSEEELDMLDLATDLTDTSRLGCQVIVSDLMEDVTIKVPLSMDVRPGKATPN